MIERLTALLADRYAIERELGRGGMATVYLARDLKHERRVAVKVLDPELAASVGAERFLAEIRLTAQLQHPNILALFDSGEAGGMLYYVMPYVPGETLRARLERERQLPVDDAVRIATAVAGALEHAHKHGVIHRDLKPENILMADGEPVVADFGIALALRRAVGERLTMTGMSLGTPQYMSPEQATGDRVIDARADIFSLGCVLYEMLAGDTPFAAPTAQATIARILTEKPRDLVNLRASVPANVAAAVERALEKLPADRWTSPRDFADALARAGSAPSTRHASRDAQRFVPWIVAALAVAIATWGWMRRLPAADEFTLRLPIASADSERIRASTVPGIPFAISPDDRQIVYVGAAPQGRERLYVRSLSELQTRPLGGTEGLPLQPNFSPDGRSIAFTIDNKLVKIPTEGGPLTTILALNPGEPFAGMSWVAKDTIICSIGGALVAVPADGGTPTIVARPDSSRGETALWGPRVVGNGSVIVYVSVNAQGVSAYRIGVLSRKTGRSTITSNLGTTVLGEIDDRVYWVTPDGAIAAATLDASATLGAATPVLEGVLVRPGGAAKAVISARGSLLYQRGDRAVRLVAVDMRGGITPMGLDAQAYSHPRWSPDGRRLAINIAKGGTSDVWVVDTLAKVFRRLTTSGLNDHPEWTGDGTRVLYRSMRTGGKRFLSQPLDGGVPDTLVNTDFDPYEAVVSNDGAWVVYRSGEGAPKPLGIYARSLTKNDPAQLVGPPSNYLELSPRLSPDGHWLATSSNESGAFEINVIAFPGAGPRHRISNGGGSEPLWSRDGKTVFYRRGSAVMAVDITTASAFAVGATSQLFDGPFLQDPSHTNWDLMPDGKHFLMLQSAEGQSETILVHGWANELRARWKK